MSYALEPSDRAPGLHLAPGVAVPDDAEIAPHVTIYAGVELGAGVRLGQGAILGRPQELDARSSSDRRPPGRPTLVGDGCAVGSNTVLVASVRLEPRSKVSDNVLVRDGTVVGEEAMIGRGSSIGLDVRVGPRTRIQHDCIIASMTVLEEDVLVSPRAMILFSNTMGRGGSTGPVVVRRASRIGAAAIIIPPAEIGEEAVVGASAMVRADVPARTVVTGTPARPSRAVRDDELLERWREPG